MLNRIEMTSLCNQVIAEPDFDRRHELLRELMANLVEFTNEHGLPDASAVKALITVRDVDLSGVSDQVFPHAIMKVCAIQTTVQKHPIEPNVIKKEWDAYVAQWNDILREAWRSKANEGYKC